MNKGILVTSFGTSHKDTRKKSIEALENMVKEKYGAERVERAFTSNIVRKIIKKNEGIYVYNQEEGIKALQNRGYSEIITMSTHILSGIEYSKLNDKYGKITKPLLFSDEDYNKIVNDHKFNDLEGNDALIFMGHGTESEADKSYEILQEKYKEKRRENIFIATVEGKITLEDIIKKIKNKNYKKVLLKPFMIVAGDHAKNDMASDEKDSWKTILENNNFEVEVKLIGMGEYDFIQNMFMDKLAQII
ncbi:MAG: sirohydrochlorin cobaltochelatase [Leptotrichiaceae bacterium]|nr:sirohydrochlorin cobaltochelatase [Leptotrichiaceae bacterium]MBP6281776.1 sirohydrochlorin cobaltochelatase [Leptotrichiaceae bacterium]MBP7100353.1 sirohydrochlorin cobaltochelatase [Leptotrichiaceae bacterium]MBP7739696.1 sirohydrochlorin cobaltochelatase [Leptotrichiaceae bacterium]